MCIYVCHKTTPRIRLQALVPAQHATGMSPLTICHTCTWLLWTHRLSLHALVCVRRVHLIGCIGVGFVVQQHLRHWAMAILHCNQEGRVLVLQRGIDVRGSPERRKGQPAMPAVATQVAQGAQPWQ